MKVDWKFFSKTPGYKSLKEAYMHDCRRAGKEARPMRNKDEYYKKFQWVIARCLHYASKQNRTPWDVLNEWESKRTYWWINFYQDCNQPKIMPESISRKDMHIRGLKKYYKYCRFPDSNNRINQRITEHLKAKRTKKARWTIEKKSRRKILSY
ncbi:hypothetical protein [Methylophaga sp.]|uniref:hypothetical protein n=1 Tax=Methylophaga sp. TaxID=2024840 RepID=UPI003A8F553B